MGHNFPSLYFVDGQHKIDLSTVDLDLLSQVSTWQTELSTLENYDQQIYRMTLPEVSSGLYLVTASSADGKNPPTGSLLVVSRYAFVLKSAQSGQTTAWASNLAGWEASRGHEHLFL